MITQYSSNPKDLTLKNYFKVVSMRIKIQGFVVMDFADKWVEARREMAEWKEQGKLKSVVDIVDGGLDKVDETLVKLYTGYNTGKLLVKVKDVSEAPAEL